MAVPSLVALCTDFWRRYLTARGALRGTFTGMFSRVDAETADLLLRDVQLRSIPLSKLRLLRGLQARSLDLTDAPADCVAHVRSDMFPVVEHVRFTRADMPRNCMSNLSTAVSLVSIDLSGARMHEHDHAARKLRKLPALRHLRIASCGFNASKHSKAFQEFAAMTALESLDLSSNLVGDEAGARICAALTNLRRLDLSFCDISEATITAIATCLRKIESLSLAGNGLMDSHIQILADAACECVELDLSANSLTDRSCHTIVEGLPRIGSLSIGQTSIRDCPVTELSRVASFNERLISLQLTELHVARPQFLPHFTSLQRLQLPRCGIDATPAFEEALLSLTQLVDLDLGGARMNELAEGGFDVLCLRNATRLERLSLVGVPLSECGCLRILLLLPRVPRLSCLVLGNQLVTDAIFAPAPWEVAYLDSVGQPLARGAAPESLADDAQLLALFRPDGESAAAARDQSREEVRSRGEHGDVVITGGRFAPVADEGPDPSSLEAGAEAEEAKGAEDDSALLADSSGGAGGDGTHERQWATVGQLEVLRELHLSNITGGLSRTASDALVAMQQRGVLVDVSHAFARAVDEARVREGRKSAPRRV
mmetsp:Transcript_22397/g.72077  ORF Transcript_22397/g.72077 Transcript_22397/m.72077 type:complete len:600 (-) Transcript_22397:7-1806(-)